MSKKYTLSDEDRKLLEEIDQLIANESESTQEMDSLNGFCAHLSSTRPHGDADFQQSLENRLMKEIEILQKSRITEEQSHSNDNEHNFSDNTLKNKQGVSWLKHALHHIGEIIMPETGKQKMGFAIIVILMIMVNLSISIPALRAQIVNAFKQIFVGENTSIIQPIEPEIIDRPLKIDNVISPEMVNGKWFMITEIGGIISGEIYSTSNLDQAQDLSTFRILVPETLPEGYSLREIKLVIGGAFLFYGGPGHDIIIAQQVVGSTFMQDAQSVNSRVTIVSTKITKDNMELQSIPLKEVDIEKTKGVWTKQSLIWEEDGISFSVGGLDLNKDEATNIALSLR